MSEFKIYVVYYGINYGPGDMGVFKTIEKAKEAADSALEFYDYADVYEYTLINDDFVESKDAVYEVKR